MIRSMTGFGLAEAERDGLVVRVEVRSVNHRFLQVKLRLGGEFADLEPQIDALVRKRCARGAVTVATQVVRTPGASGLLVDEQVAARYVRELRTLAGRLEVSDDLGLAALAQLPGVVAATSDPKRHRREAKLVLEVVDAALERLSEMRRTEGRNLERELRKHLLAITRLRARIEKRMPSVVRQHHLALRKRVAELLDRATVVPAADLARELAVLADRMDVSEELARLDSHLSQLDSLLERGGEAGRRLDFLVQELFRETNTIGSKCNDAKVAHAVVELKTHIERIREQVQNVE